MAVLLATGAARDQPIRFEATATTVSWNATHVSARTSAQAVTVTLDWWQRNDTRFGDKWGNASAFVLDLQQPALRVLAKALAPAYLRLGGSPEDSITYDVKGGCVPGDAPTGAAEGGYFCSQVHPAVYGCLHMARWEALLAFASDMGFGLLLGLNACTGRANASAPMDLSNIQELLEYTAALPAAQRAALRGFELGNELDRTITAEAWTQDAARLRALLDRTLGPGMLLVGPDIGSGNTGYFEYIAKAAPKATLTALTYHEYVNCVPATASDGMVLPLACLMKAHATLSTLAPVAAGGGVELWVGESAEHSGGGVLGLTNTFTSSFYYAYQLGLTAMFGVQVVARQDLVGGDYGLVNKTSWMPAPDFYVAWLWRSFMGPRVLATTVPRDAQAAGLRGFTQCTPPPPAGAEVGADGGGTTLVLINFNTRQSISVDLSADGMLAPEPAEGQAADAEAGAGEPRSEYHLTGDPRGTEVTLNGTPLRFDGQTLPTLTPRRVAASLPVAMAPASIAFIIMPGAPCPAQ